MQTTTETKTAAEIKSPIVRWVSAPPAPRPGRKPNGAATKDQWVLMAIGALRLRPNQWAYVRDVDQPGSAGRIFRKYGCDFTTRKQDDGTYAVYAQYVAA